MTKKINKSVTWDKCFNTQLQPNLALAKQFEIQMKEKSKDEQGKIYINNTTDNIPMTSFI